MTERKTKTGPRYSGTDSESWVIKTPTGLAALKDDKGKSVSNAFTVFKEAMFAARRHTNQTGEYALPVRA